MLAALLWAAAAQGAVGESPWGGAWWIAGFALHPRVPLFAVPGSLMISRIRIPKLQAVRRDSQLSGDSW